MKLLSQVSYRVLDLTISKRMHDEHAAALVMLDGVPGSGKSSWALSAAEYLDPNFSVDNVCFNQKEYIKRVDSADRGDILIFDEAGEFGSRTSMGQSNVDTSLILEMIRYTVISTIFTVPSIYQIDINATRLMNFWLTTIVFDRSTANPFYKDKTGVKFRVIDQTKLGKSPKEPGWNYPTVTLKTYRKPNDWVKSEANKIGMTLENTVGVTTLHSWHPKGVWLGHCSMDLWDAYYKRKDQHFRDILKRVQEKMRQKELKQEARAEKMG